MDHVLTPSEKLHNSYLSLQILSDFRVLLEKLFTNDLHGDL